jgi:hypothetical protein
MVTFRTEIGSTAPSWLTHAAKPSIIAVYQ